MPSPSRSPSAEPQPHDPGLVLFGSFGQPSLQSAVPSPSESASATPHPQDPALVLFGSAGQPSTQSGVPSPSLSVSGFPQPQAPAVLGRRLAPPLRVDVLAVDRLLQPRQLPAQIPGALEASVEEQGLEPAVEVRHAAAQLRLPFGDEHRPDAAPLPLDEFTSTGAAPEQPFLVRLGPASGLVARRMPGSVHVGDVERTREMRQPVSIVVQNRGAQPAQVMVVERLQSAGVDVDQASEPYTRTPDSLLQFTIEVPAESEKKVSFTLVRAGPE